MLLVGHRGCGGGFPNRLARGYNTRGKNNQIHNVTCDGHKSHGGKCARGASDTKGGHTRGLRVVTLEV